MEVVVGLTSAIEDGLMHDVAPRGAPKIAAAPVLAVLQSASDQGSTPRWRSGWLRVDVFFPGTLVVTDSRGCGSPRSPLPF